MFSTMKMSSTIYAWNRHPHNIWCDPQYIIHILWKTMRGQNIYCGEQNIYCGEHDVYPVGNTKCIYCGGYTVENTKFIYCGGHGHVMSSTVYMTCPPQYIRSSTIYHPQYKNISCGVLIVGIYCGWHNSYIWCGAYTVYIIDRHLCYKNVKVENRTQHRRW